MNSQLFVACLLLAIGVIQSKTIFRRHKVARQLTTECEEGRRKCPGNDNCIRESWFCDGDNDCGDDSDEPSTCPPRVCPEGYFKCLTRNRCLHTEAVCDGTNDCTDGSDEPTECSTRTCEADRLRCDNGQCIDKVAFCQGYSQCRDNSLQRTAVNCPAPTSCPSGQAMCPGVGRCINTRYFCDSDNDCGDNSDEEPSYCSSRSCEPNEVRCTSGQCIDRSGLCAGHYSCRDNSLNRNSDICRDTPVINPHDGPSPPSNGSATMNCMTAMMNFQRVCGSNPFSGMFTDEMTEEQKRQKLIGTDMRQLCSPVQQFFSCFEQTFAACDNAELPPEVRHAVAQTQSMITTGRVMLDYVCEQEVDVINRNKACLLQAASDQPQSEGPGQPPNNLLIRTAFGSCMEHMQPNHEHPMCIAPAFQECVKHVVANQCGDEIAGVLDGLGSRVRQVACPQVAHHGLPQKKRRGYPSSFKAFYSFF